MRPLLRLAQALQSVCALVALVVTALGTSGCGSSSPAIEHVLIVSVDGMRPDLLTRAHAPVMQGWLHRGSYTLHARTVTEGYTVPSHVSMLTGVVPDRHGVTWDNHIEDSYPNVPTLFELAKKAGLTTGLVVGKTKLIVLTKPGTLDWSYVAQEGREGDLDVARHAVDMLRDHRPSVMFIHFGGVDIVGHESGWGSPAQMQAMEVADRAAGLVQGILDETRMAASTLIILTSIRKDFDLARAPSLAINTMATFATACAALGLEVVEPVDGKPVWEVFERMPRQNRPPAARPAAPQTP